MKYFYTVIVIIDLMVAALWLTRPGWGWVIYMILSAIFFGVKAIGAWKNEESADGTN